MLLDPNAGYGEDPSASFNEERVFYEKKLKPFVDTGISVERLTEGKARVRKKEKRSKTKRRGSLVEDSDEDYEKNMERMEKAGGLDARLRRQTFSHSPKSVSRDRGLAVKKKKGQHVKLRRMQLPVLLSSDFKELPNLSPQQSQDINISHGLRDYASGEHKLALKKFTRAAEQVRCCVCGKERDKYTHAQP